MADFTLPENHFEGTGVVFWEAVVSRIRPSHDERDMLTVCGQRSESAFGLQSLGFHDRGRSASAPRQTALPEPRSEQLDCERPPGCVSIGSSTSAAGRWVYGSIPCTRPSARSLLGAAGRSEPVEDRILRFDVDRLRLRSRPPVTQNPLHGALRRRLQHRQQLLILRKTTHLMLVKK